MSSVIERVPRSRRVRSFVALSLALGLGGCDTAELLQVDLPGNVTADDIENPDLANTVRVSAIGDFEWAWDNYAREADGGKPAVLRLPLRSPRAAELLFDVRFLANPYFEEKLRPRTGLDPEVARFVLESAGAPELLDRLRDLLEFLLPLYDREGKAYVTIGVGCTGGRHRSVAVAVSLAAALAEQGREVNLEHRDTEREA